MHNVREREGSRMSLDFCLSNCGTGLPFTEKMSRGTDVVRETRSLLEVQQLNRPLRGKVRARKAAKDTAPAISDL